jgi:hypothetical protein
MQASSRTQPEGGRTNSSNSPLARPAGGGLEKGVLGKKAQSFGWQSFSEEYRRTPDTAVILGGARKGATAFFKSGRLVCVYSVECLRYERVLSSQKSIVFDTEVDGNTFLDRIRFRCKFTIGQLSRHSPSTVRKAQ